MKIRFRTEPDRVTTSQPTALQLTVTNSTGETVEDLMAVHEKLMHLVIVSSDRDEFAHLHPERGPDGAFTILHTFSRPETYWLFAEVASRRDGSLLERHRLEVVGDLPRGPRQSRTPGQRGTIVTDGTQVELRRPLQIRARTPVSLGLVVTDPATGASPTDLVPYLGAPIHAVFIGTDGRFLHAHSGEHDPESGGGHSGHATHARPVLEVTAVFPQADRYRMWAQFRRGERVITAPFDLDVLD